MNNIINFEDILNKKIELENKERFPEYKKDEYKDLLSVKEITSLIDLSKKIIDKYNTTFKGIFENMDTEKYIEFTKKLIQNYVEFKYTYKFVEPDDDNVYFIDFLLNTFEECKMENSEAAIKDLKEQWKI